MECKLALGFIWRLVLAFKLLVTFYTQTLHGREEQDRFEGKTHERVVHSTDNLLRDLLRHVNTTASHVYVKGKRQDAPFLDAANSLPEIWDMKPDYRCDDREGDSHDPRCIHKRSAIFLSRAEASPFGGSDERFASCQWTFTSGDCRHHLSLRIRGTPDAREVANGRLKSELGAHARINASAGLAVPTRRS